MCGIVGIFNRHSSAPVDEHTIRAMCKLVAHRGPDAEGVYISGSVGIGHRRLSILDLSDRGRQPLSTPDGRFVITYNGEVYNYLELRAELEAAGCVFRTDTDTEVVLTLYARLGSAALQRLNGMFAFAVWDNVRRVLFLARDRVGIKPLYYAETGDGIVFASEAKALFVDPRVECAVSAPAVRAYMAFGYVPGETTLVKGIRKLLPGHFLEVGKGELEAVPYWDVKFLPNQTRSVGDTAEELRTLLMDAVKIHLRSDVPVGVFLSGGFDSSTMVALLAEAGFSAVKTFSVAYRQAGPGYDETRYAQMVADRFGTDHHVLNLDAQHFVDFIPDYVWHMDEPVAEAAGISLYFIAKLLREHVVVALSGEGSDELFAGYQIYQYMTWIERYRRLPARLRQRYLEPLLMTVAAGKIKRYVRLAGLPLETRYLGVALPDAVEAQRLFTADFEAVGSDAAPHALLAPYYSKTAGDDVLSRMLYADLKTWLVDDLLIKADKMTMANAVELRVPFLDHRVVEYAATIPSRFKIRYGQGKWILKNAMRTRLPKAIVTRPKMGFPTPLAMMFRRDLAGYIQDLLLSDRSLARGYFKPDAVRRIVSDHIGGQRDHHKLLWQLIVLEEWHRCFSVRFQMAA